MVDKKIYTHLELDSFGVTISYSSTKTAIIQLLKEKNVSINILTEDYITLESRLFSLDNCFYICLRFSEEKLITIGILTNKMLDGKELRLRYNDIQKALERELGYPHNRLQFYIQSIMARLVPNKQRAYWQYKSIKVEHYILNRFGMEERIGIKLCG